mmetsp:Transcript_61311/g.145989  ORF Transcript_61311/g.145989 Transcript_61311/m.145989 type:complete len:207 (+) Transcript_61311:81-701(+)
MAEGAAAVAAPDVAEAPAPSPETAAPAGEDAGSSSTAPVATATEVKPSPPENLDLREKLKSYTEVVGQDAARGALNNALKVLQRLQQDPTNTKMHEMRRDVLVRLVGEELLFAFVAAAFKDDARPEVFAWQAGSEDAIMQLNSAVHEVQRAADLCLDPETVSFAEVSKLVQEGRTLPGIQEVNDSVFDPKPAKASSLDRPKKPWEK